MDTTPHTHTPSLHTYHDGWKGWFVNYGDTTLRVYPPGTGFLMKRWTPSARRLAYITRLAIRRHDRGTLRAAKREERKEQAREQMRSIRSDWYMDSQQRMDDLHAEAIKMDQPPPTYKVMSDPSWYTSALQR